MRVDVFLEHEVPGGIERDILWADVDFQHEPLIGDILGCYEPDLGRIVQQVRVTGRRHTFKNGGPTTLILITVPDSRP